MWDHKHSPPDTYWQRLAIVDDVSEHLAGSNAKTEDPCEGLFFEFAEWLCPDGLANDGTAEDWGLEIPDGMELARRLEEVPHCLHAYWLAELLNTEAYTLIMTRNGLEFSRQEVGLLVPRLSFETAAAFVGSLVLAFPPELRPAGQATPGLQLALRLKAF